MIYFIHYSLYLIDSIIVRLGILILFVTECKI